MNFKNITIRRTIVHKVIGKTINDRAYGVPSPDIHKLDLETEQTLLKRITTAITKSKRFFETKLQNTDPNSFFNYANKLQNDSKELFINNTIAICEIAVNAHQNRGIPGGLIIVIDANIDHQPAVIVIKAEVQEAMTVKGNSVELMKELFLSPAKEFYKIGFLVHKNPDTLSPAAFHSFVYDDNFTPTRNDIAEYFYKDFLGFSTSDNDKLKTNNFLKNFTEFIDSNVDDHHSRRHLKISIKSDYRESSSTIIDPTSYIQYFEAEPLMKEKFEKQIIASFPMSFTKDLSLVEHSLRRSTRNITKDLKLTGPSEQVDNAEILDSTTANKNVNRLITEIQSGKVSKVVVIPTLDGVTGGMAKV